MNLNLTVYFDLNIEINRSNSINAFGSLFLIIFGCVGNLLAFLVFLFSNSKKFKKSLPKILDSNYFISLTIINIIYLLIHFYLVVLPRLIHHFNLNKSNSLLFRLFIYDINPAACKSLTYLKYVARYSNITLTLCYSLQRTFAIYFPFKIRSYRIKNIYFILASFILSILMPIYVLKLKTTISSVDDKILKKILTFL